MRFGQDTLTDRSSQTIGHPISKKFIAYSTYRDKVEAGWLGKCLGGVVGGPLENHKQWLNLEEDNLWPSEFLANDDFDIQVVWLEAMQERGVFLTHADLIEYWQDRCWYNFCEYGHFLYNIQRGIVPPLSGIWNNKFFSESEGCPIRSEIWAFVAPGNPDLAAEMARMDGELDHGGLSVEIEAYLAAVASLAFFSQDLEGILLEGLNVLPKNSRVGEVLKKTLSICKSHPVPRQAWFLLIREFGDRDASKAITNLAIKFMALLLGGNDFKKVIHICANSGWDTDCTAATAGALWGVIYGKEQLPQDWLELLGKNLMCGIEVKHKNAPLDTFVDATCLLGVEMCALRNLSTEITNAPYLEPRSAPPTFPSIRAEYQDQPVLWKEKSSTVELIFDNPTANAIGGLVSFALPPGLSIAQEKMPVVTVLPYSDTRMLFDFNRKNSDAPLPDKNLISVFWFENTDTLIAETKFGLCGARQWQVYGPYWDMYDTTRYSECPYNNQKVHCHPWKVDCGSDSYQQYARLDKEYLDEKALVGANIPSELPFGLEMGEELIRESDLGGYTGQACYYFTRTIRASDYSGKASLVIGRTGPFRAWLDGEEIGCAENSIGWTAYNAEGIEITLTGGWQRLVIKLIRQQDAFYFHPILLRSNDPFSFSNEKAGISYICDFLEDQPEAI